MRPSPWIWALAGLLLLPAPGAAQRRPGPPADRTELERRVRARFAEIVRAELGPHCGAAPGGREGRGVLPSGAPGAGSAGNGAEGAATVRRGWPYAGGVPPAVARDGGATGRGGADHAHRDGRAPAHARSEPGAALLSVAGGPHGARAASPGAGPGPAWTPGSGRDAAETVRHFAQGPLTETHRSG